MKKIIFLFSILFSITASFAQIAIGIKAGVNFNNTKIKSDPSGLPDLSDGSVSFHAGIFTKMKLNDRLAVIPEIQFIQKGYSITSIGSGAQVIVSKVRINYIEMPILLSYSVFHFLNIETGVGAGIKLSANAKRDKERVDISDEFETFEFSPAVGIRINLTKNILLIQRYSWGITPINEWKPASNQVAKESNRNYMISLAYLF